MRYGIKVGGANKLVLNLGNKFELDKFCLNSVSENSFNEYILEVDLEYYNELYE